MNIKKTIVLITLLTTVFNSFSQNEISGVITYYFNAYQGEKPDIGAKLYLIDSLSMSKIKNYKYLIEFPDLKFKKNYSYANSIEELEELKQSKEYKKLLSKERSLKKRKHKDKYKEKYNKVMSDLKPFLDKIKREQESINEVEKKLREKKAFTSEEWSEYITVASKVFSEVKYLKGVKKKTIDNTGGYIFKNIPNNVYHLIIQSNNRKSYNSLEILGKIKVITVKIDGSNEDISTTFYPQL